MDLELRELDKYTGTEHYYNFMGVLITDGVKYIMENGYTWFVADVVALIKAHPRIREYLKRDTFLTARLEVEDNEADLILEDGDYNKLYSQHYSFTDAKRNLKLFYVSGVLMLSNEY
ncbi:MAG: hypothetical protein OH337_03695 [Candidatus Parvarchaeota archaeon]|nr:hypothetical protein [Candidatus Haiyanarchaeum thermophilum]